MDYKQLRLSQAALIIDYIQHSNSGFKSRVPNTKW